MKRNFKKRATRRLKIIAGQIGGLEKMVRSEKYCIDIIGQALAIREALSSFNRLVLENHLKTCYKRQMKLGKQESKAIRELLEVYNLSGK